MASQERKHNRRSSGSGQMTRGARGLRTDGAEKTEVAMSMRRNKESKISKTQIELVDRAKTKYLGARGMINLVKAHLMFYRCKEAL